MLNLDVSPAPTVKLTNGLIVANFSSGHPFIFEDDRVLGACKDDRVQAGQVDPKEITATCTFEHGEERVEIVDVDLQPRLTSNCIALLDDAYEIKADVIIVSFMLLEAIREHRKAFGVNDNTWHFVRSIRRRGRNGLICIDRFCV